MTTFTTSSKHREGFTGAAGCRSNHWTRRSFVKSSAALIAASAGGVALPLSVLAQTKKSPQKLVKYQPTPKLNRKCADCINFMANQRACKVVEGPINAEGWCLRWAKKTG